MKAILTKEGERVLILPIVLPARSVAYMEVANNDSSVMTRVHLTSGNYKDLQVGMNDLRKMLFPEYDPLAELQYRGPFND